METTVKGKETLDWRPLQLAGTRRKNEDDSYTVRHKDVSRAFCTEREAIECQEQLAMHHYPQRTNLYSIDEQQGVVTLRLMSRKGSRAPPKGPTSTAVLDLADLRLLRDRKQTAAWYDYQRTAMSRDLDDTFFRLATFVLGLPRDQEVWHKDRNPYNHRRANLTTIFPIELPEPWRAKRGQDPFTWVDAQTWQAMLQYAQQDALQLRALAQELAVQVHRHHVASMPVPVYTQETLLKNVQQLDNNASKELAANGTDLGCRFLLHFFRAAMMHCCHFKYRIPLAAVWQNETYRVRLFTTMLRTKMYALCRASVVMAAGLSFYKVGNFPPKIARTLYDVLLPACPKSQCLRVLDPCSGFGGRFLGFYLSARCTEYIGIDPNPRLVQPYADMTAWLHRYMPSAGEKRFRFIRDGAECDSAYASVPDYSIDVCFTSPPYFDTECYGTEPQQSAQKFKTLDAWIDGFLLTMLRKSAQKVRSRGGTYAINIKPDRHAADLYDRMHRVLSQDLDFDAVLPHLALPVRRLPGLKDRTPRSEPIFVWRRR